MAKQDNNKKKVLVALLFGCSIIIVFLLYFELQQKDTQQNVAVQLDSLINRELSLYNLPPRNIRTQTIQITPEFSRKIYSVRVPGGVSRTWLHAELAQKLHQSNVRTVGFVSFPERDITIQVAQGNTLVRTIHLLPDTTAVRAFHRAYMVAFFDQRPDVSMMRQLASFGEAIPIVLRSSSVQQALRWYGQLPEQYQHVYFWIEDPDASHPGAAFNANHFIQAARTVRSERRNPVLMYIPPADNRPDALFFEQLRQENIRIVEVATPYILSERNGKIAFEQDLLRFSQSAFRGEQPLAFLRLNRTTLDWFDQHINDLKKGGILLSQPVYR